MKKVIVILHGWGKSGKDYQVIQSLFEKQGYTVFAPDMPGFGSEPLQKTMVLNDYVLFIKNYLKEKNIQKAILIGHSFGGRVAAKFTAQYPTSVEKLVLTGAPLIKQSLSLKKRLVTVFVKPVKKVIEGMPAPFQQFMTKSVYKVLGEWDYYKAGKLKATFKHIIHEDLKDILPHIPVPTYIIWGEKDTFVPFSVGQRIATLIPHALVASIPASSHKLPYENPTVFAKYVLDFLQ